MRMANVTRLGVKELQTLLRDPIMLALIVYAFTVSIHAAATAMPETLNEAPITVVDEDRSPLSRRLVDAFQPPYFEPPTPTTLARMESRLDEGLTAFALDIPPAFQRDVLAGRQPALQLNVDATRMTQAFSGAGYIEAIVNQEVGGFVERYRAGASPAAPVALELRALYNPQLNQAWFGGVMELTARITMLAIILTGAALIREREHGTLEHLMVMPVTPLEVMLAKILSMGLVVLIAASLSLLLVVQALIGVPIAGSVPLFLAGTVLHLFAATSMGVALGTFARSMPQFALLILLVLLPLLMLSGAMTPRESMPAFIRWLMLAAPDTHFVMLSQAILFRGAGIAVVWPQFLALLVVGVALFAASLAGFRRAVGALAH